MIELENLTKIYSSKEGETVALENIDLTVPDGSVFGVIGLSGAGKSTLVRCLNLLEQPTRGRVLIDGEDITAVKKKRLRELRRSIGMIFQNFNLLEQRTVAANVRFPLELVKTPRAAATERVRELLALVGLSEKANAYPSQLSGGQKQRVAIARALATNPKYLLCDEATSALDPATTESILGLLKRINRELGVTIVIITHEMKVVESACTHVAVLGSSRIAEVGKSRRRVRVPAVGDRKTAHHSGAHPLPCGDGRGQAPPRLPRGRERYARHLGARHGVRRARQHSLCRHPQDRRKDVRAHGDRSPGRPRSDRRRQAVFNGAKRGIQGGNLT